MCCLKTPLAMVGGGGIRRPTPPSLATSDTLYVCTRFFLNILLLLLLLSLLLRLLQLSLLILFLRLLRSSCLCCRVSVVTAVVTEAAITFVAAVADVTTSLMLV